MCNFYVFTFVYDGLLFSEISERWKFRDAILLGQSLVVDLDEIYSEGVGVVVDLLKFFQNFVAGRAAAGVWN